MEYSNEDVSEAFTKIYDEKYWGIGSGTGSSPEVNIEYMSFISNFIIDNKIKSVLDFGCGDWQFSRYLSWEKCSYHGVDVVESVIETNRQKFANENISFSIMSDLEALPETDLCVSKDVFQHLPISTVKQSIAALKKKAKLLVITNDIYPDKWLNVDIEPGAGRAIKLYEEPFNEKAIILKSYSFIAYDVFLKKEVVLIQGERF